MAGNPQVCFDVAVRIKITMHVLKITIKPNVIFSEYEHYRYIIPYTDMSFFLG